MKDAKMIEIEQCLDYVLRGQRFLCQHATNILLEPKLTQEKESVKLDEDGGRDSKGDCGRTDDT